MLSAFYIHKSFIMRNHCFCWVFKTQIIRSANMHTVCMHVQFKNIKRSGVPAIERIEHFFFEELPHHRGIIIPGHNQQRSLTLTNAHQLQIPATMATNIQGKFECNANIKRSFLCFTLFIHGKVMRILASKSKPFRPKRSEYIWREGNSYKKYIIQYISPGYQPYL